MSKTASRAACRIKHCSEICWKKNSFVSVDIYPSAQSYDQFSRQEGSDCNNQKQGKVQSFEFPIKFKRQDTDRSSPSPSIPSREKISEASCQLKFKHSHTPAFTIGRITEAKKIVRYKFPDQKYVPSFITFTSWGNTIPSSFLGHWPCTVSKTL